MAKISAIHVPAELKNIAINGAFDLWQEKQGTTTTVNTAASQSPLFTADMFKARSFGTTVKNYNFLRSTNIPSLAQSGFQSTYSYQFQVLTAIASPAAGDLVLPIEYSVEGFDYEKIHTKTVTFGFWFFATVPGTYSFALGNSAGSRSYVTTFTVNGASTWEFKTITVTLDNTGTWAFDNTVGITVFIAAFSGSGTATSTLNAWQSANVVAATTATNYFATVNAIINIAQFSIVEGPLGFGATGFARQGKDIQQETSMCLRYYWKSSANAVLCAGEFNTTTAVRGIIQFPVQMRTPPTASVSAGTDLVFDRPGTSAASGSGTPTYAGVGVDALLINATSGSVSTTGFSTMISFQNNGFFVADARL